MRSHKNDAIEIPAKTTATLTVASSPTNKFADFIKLVSAYIQKEMRSPGNVESMMGFSARLFDQNKVRVELLLPHANQLIQVFNRDIQAKERYLAELVTAVRADFQAGGVREKNIKDLNTILEKYPLSFDETSIARIQFILNKMAQHLVTELNTDNSWQQNLPKGQEKLFIRNFIQAYTFHALSVWFNARQAQLQVTYANDPAGLETASAFLIRQQRLLNMINTNSWSKDNVQFKAGKPFSIEPHAAPSVYEAIENDPTAAYDHQTMKQYFGLGTTVHWLSERLQQIEKYYAQDSHAKRAIPALNSKLLNTYQAIESQLKQAYLARDAEMFDAAYNKATRQIDKLMKASSRELEEIYLRSLRSTKNRQLDTTIQQRNRDMQQTNSFMKPMVRPYDLPFHTLQEMHQWRPDFIKNKTLKTDLQRVTVMPEIKSLTALSIITHNDIDLAQDLEKVPLRRAT